MRPNAGVEAAYRRALQASVRKMHESVLYWLRAAYRANEPEMAMDATPAVQLQRAIRKLTRRWSKKFDDLAEDLAKHFAKASSKRTDAQLRAILKRGGITVEFRMTPAQRDVFQATVKQNVSLIRSLPSQYLAQVEGMVMRSVQTGRDLATLTRDIEKQYGVTRRRAALIARDQNNKATSALTRVRQIDLGITEGIWVHSHAGEVPRPTHVKMDGKKYNLAEGMWDADEHAWIHPGELINCRCVSRPVIPGLS